MAKASRFGVVFAEDGATMTYWAGTESPAVLGISKLSASVRRAAEQLGFKTAIVNTCAAAAKENWSDAECMAQMRRRASAWVNDNWTVSDGARDFHDLVTAVMEATGRDRPDVEKAILAKPTDYRDGLRKKFHVRILQLKLERATAAPADDGDDLLADL